MKTLEDFADKILKTLNPGLPLGKVHPQKLILLEVLERREKQTRTAVLDEVERELPEFWLDNESVPFHCDHNNAIQEVKAIIQSKRTEI